MYRSSGLYLHRNGVIKWSMAIANLHGHGFSKEKCKFYLHIFLYVNEIEFYKSYWIVSIKRKIMTLHRLFTGSLTFLSISTETSHRNVACFATNAMNYVC
jgi:hypothetical protein